VHVPTTDHPEQDPLRDDPLRADPTPPDPTQPHGEAPAALIGNTPDGQADGAIRSGREQPDGFDG
jgi:hypothetical protein